MRAGPRPRSKDLEAGAFYCPTDSQLAAEPRARDVGKPLPWATHPDKSVLFSVELSA